MSGRNTHSGGSRRPRFTAEEVLDVMEDFDEPCFDGSDDDLSAEELEGSDRYAMGI